jgi:hypothetical protein
MGGLRDVILVAGLGVISGYYIFKPLIQESLTKKYPELQQKQIEQTNNPTKELKVETAPSSKKQ